MFNSQVNTLLEEFKIPFDDPHCPTDWKDWYHYILYDPNTGIRILYNICFNGRPELGFITDVFFITVPKNFLHNNMSDPSDEETYGFSRCVGWEKGDLSVKPMNFQTRDISFKILGSQSIMTIENKDLNISFSLLGRAKSTPIYLPECYPYGKGFVGWGVAANYKMGGNIEIGNRLITITDAWYSYHDRNFGRFNWGDIGWTWFVVSMIDQSGHSWVYVLHQSNNPDHTKVGSPILYIYKQNRLIKIFLDQTIYVQVDWSDYTETPVILPGSMASVFSDRNVLSPKRLSVTAKDERHSVRLSLKVSTHTELIVPDSEERKFTYLKELSGTIEVEQSIYEQEVQSDNGFFYAEIVH